MNRTPRVVGAVKAARKAQWERAQREQEAQERLAQNKRAAAVALIHKAVEKADQADGVRRNSRGQRIDSHGQFVKVSK